ncbi:hypothetical protein C8F04DRAFT_1244317 [Mycena alexandri]|uniref:ATP-dependent DNA helicase n=1 Tax=Mycena alexandri TaxID=1745969 RepID=A0AAD6WMW6_9AGAR|nr:hypothetical protein C8F04DRAFT_1244317 [Mycena alexandri]
MLGKEFLALLSRNISIAKGMDADVSFGGISLIDCGDFHQFPPVATGPSEALYYPIDTIRDSIDSKIGRMIYEEFTTVVLLKEQLRVTDTVWLDFLRHLRVGNVQEHHLAMLRTLVVQGRGIQGNIDFETAPWNEASLVTPRHAVRTQWNDEAARKMCKATGRQLYICRAHDTYKGRALNLQERHNLAAHLSKKSRRNQKHSMQAKDLPDEIEIAIGMQVMVTSNLETDLDLTNGARGEIVDIFLDPDEPAVGDEPVVRLEKMPAYILVKLERTRAAQLEGLEERVIPIEPTTTTYHMKVKLPGGQLTQKTVKRQQYPLTAAYAFTDYRSQGQHYHMSSSISGHRPQED